MVAPETAVLRQCNALGNCGVTALRAKCPELTAPTATMKLRMRLGIREFLGLWGSDGSASHEAWLDTGVAELAARDRAELRGFATELVRGRWRWRWYTHRASSLFRSISHSHHDPVLHKHIECVAHRDHYQRRLHAAKQTRRKLCHGRIRGFHTAGCR